LWSRDVLCSSRGLSRLDLQCLSVNLQLACGKRIFDELHLQRRMDRTPWRHLHSVRGRKVQGVNRIGRVLGLSVKLQLARGELSFDELHL
jgi:hypothetical protein